MEYGGPSYTRNREVQFGVASQKRLIGLHMLRRDVMARHRRGGGQVLCWFQPLSSLARRADPDLPLG